MAQLNDLIVTGASRFLGNIYGTLNGNADTATKATQDSAGQQINTTYIKGLSVSGKTITYTKGDGKTGTITTQDTNTTYSNATTSAAGLMSASDKTKLDGIATGANKTTVDSALSSTSTNPVQNKVVNTAISNLNSLVGDTAVATQIANAVSVATSNTLSMMMPVGYIFQWVPTNGGPDLSTADKVKAYYGFGTWEEVSGRFLLGRSGSYSVGSTGGNETHTHTNPSTGVWEGTSGNYSGTSGNWSGTSGSTAITVAQMPSHRHGEYGDFFNGYPEAMGSGKGTGPAGRGYYWNGSFGYSDWERQVETSSVGSGQGHTHSLPSHNHSIPSHNHSIPSHSHSMGNTGSTNSMPPYLSVYIWKRIA